MNKLTTYIFIFIWLLSGSIALAQQPAPQGFHYQAVIRDNGGVPMVNKTVSIQISILDGAINGVSQYTETHSVTTNPVGVLELMVGSGTKVSGSFGGITWGTGPKFLKTEVDVTGGNNYTTLGTTQMLSVPYALYAEKAGNAGITQFNAGSGIDITGTTISNSAPDKEVKISGTSKINVFGTYPNFIVQNTDVDTSLTNEIQTLSLSGNNVLTLSKNGGSVTLADIKNYKAGKGIAISNDSIINTSPDKTVKLQGGGTTVIGGIYPNFTINTPEKVLIAGNGINVNGDTIFNTKPDKNITINTVGALGVSGTYPNFTIQDKDSDTSATNEIQTMILQNGTNLVLSKGGGSVTIPSAITYTAGTGIDITNTVVTNTKPDKDVVLNRAGTVRVNGTYPNFTIYSADNDSSVTNEIQTLSISGSMLSLSNGGGSVSLAGASQWTTNVSDIYYTTGKVGIGTTTPKASLQVTAGDIYITDTFKGIIMKSPSGFCFKVTIKDDGTFQSSAITCP